MQVLAHVEEAWAEDYRRKDPASLTTEEVLHRWPRLVSQLICESLGYFTPRAAANAILEYKRGHAFYCEWYVHMAGGYNREKVLEVGREVIKQAIRTRKYHRGYMADYPTARALVEQVRRGGPDPLFASWF